MTEKNYLMVNNMSSTVVNTCVWDGNSETWQPPLNTTMLIADETIALVWEEVLQDNKIVDYVLIEQIGAGAIGFKWDGQFCKTNQQKPIIPT